MTGIQKDTDIFNAVLDEFGHALNMNERRSLLSEFDKDNAEAYYKFGIVLGDKKEYTGAEIMFSRVVVLRPEHARAWNNLGSIALRKGDFESARKAFEFAIKQNPNLYEPYCNLGVLHHEQGNVLGAVNYFESAEKITPDDPVLLCNLAMARWERGEYEKARKTIRHCLDKNQDHKDAKYIESFIALAYGEFTTGWSGYKYRFGRMASSGELKIPIWRGEALNGKTILLTPEQGLGEQLLFASCIPDLLNQGVRCILVCADKLKGLFQQSFSTAIVKSISDFKSLSSYGSIDFQLSIAELGLYFRTENGSFQNDKAFIKINPTCVDTWRADLLKLGGRLNVGISWIGGSSKTGGASRSIPLSEWYPILRVESVNFINLQYGDCSQEINKVENEIGKKIICYPVQQSDYRSTAELVSALDLIICVDTSLAYLCAGLLKRAWILLSTGPTWAYQISGSNSPWFPNSIIYRMSHPQESKELIKQVAKDLQQLKY